MSFFKLASVCALVLGSVNCALAQQTSQRADQTSEIEVSYKDLDLQTYQGRSALDHRIALAASRLCTQVAAPEHGDAWSACRQSAIADAQRQARDVIAAVNPRVRFASAVNRP